MLDLTNEQKALFALLGADMDISPSTDWNEVEKEAAHHTVYLQAYNSKNRPKEIIWNKAISYVATNLKSIYAVIELDRIMRARNLKYIILKGIASASYYNDYTHRALGDCDFLIEPEKRDIVKKVLLEAGYEISGEGNNHHWVFSKPGQNLEMHFEIPGVPDGKAGAIVKEYIKNILTETATFTLQEHEINIPLPEYHGLILILHMLHHMITVGIGLRHLMDWCLFVDKTYREEFWDTELLPVFRKIGIFKYAQIITKAGSMYFGTACPKWCMSIEESLCDEVMNDILTSGNFGRKNKSRSNAGMMISDYGVEGRRHGAVYNLWVTMLKGVKGYHYKTLEKYPFLYPVFIVEFISRRIWRVITGKRVSIIKSRKYIDDRRSVYDRLELFKTEGD